MRWSYDELLDTPMPVVDELVAWMNDIYAAQEKARKDAERDRAFTRR